MDEFRRLLQQCDRCPLSLTRHWAVCDNGPVPSPVLLLGEAPGGDEDLSGRPFTGQAGKELDEFLSVLGLSREEIYIGNVVKCRPVRPSRRGRYGDFANRKPLAGEIKACSPWLEEEIRILRPKIIITLGGVPLSKVLGRPVKIGDFRGRPFYSESWGCHIFPLYHPASVIYDRSKKEIYLADLQSLKNWLAESKSSGRYDFTGNESQ